MDRGSLHGIGPGAGGDPEQSHNKRRGPDALGCDRDGVERVRRAKGHGHDRQGGVLMAFVNSAIDAVLRAFYAAFGWAPPALGLTILSAAAGIGMLWVFSRTSDGERTTAVKRKVYAALLEMRVYADEPGV